MFSDLPTSVFNPMRDIWLPLDLSNAAAFNIVMALSATHLARMQGQRHTPPEALRFKGEAINIISTWVNDSTMALSDQAMTGILRLLTYEVSSAYSEPRFSIVPANPKSSLSIATLRPANRMEDTS